MKRLCGLRPTGRLHIGHYFSVIKPAQEFDAVVLIADYHAPFSSENTRAEIYRTFSKLGGVNDVLVQSEIFNAKLYFELLSLSYMGELERMTQFKSALENMRNAHLLTYPVLMAHDVFGYNEVLIGADQKQHLEFAQTLIHRYNNKMGTAIPIPLANTIGGRVMSLDNPTKKMSKSAPNGCLFLDDTADTIRQKIGKAVSSVDGLNNLLEIYNRLGGETVSFDVLKETKRFKDVVAQRIIDTFKAS